MGGGEYSVVAWKILDGDCNAYPMIPYPGGDCVLRRPDGKYVDENGVCCQKKDQPPQESKKVIHIHNVARSQFK